MKWDIGCGRRRNRSDASSSAPRSSAGALAGTLPPLPARFEQPSDGHPEQLGNRYPACPLSAPVAPRARCPLLDAGPPAVRTGRSREDLNSLSRHRHRLSARPPRRSPPPFAQPPHALSSERKNLPLSLAAPQAPACELMRRREEEEWRRTAGPSGTTGRSGQRRPDSVRGRPERGEAARVRAAMRKSWLEKGVDPKELARDFGDEELAADTKGMSGTLDVDAYIERTFAAIPNFQLSRRTSARSCAGCSSTTRRSRTRSPRCPQILREILEPETRRLVRYGGSGRRRSKRRRDRCAHPPFPEWRASLLSGRCDP